jgi:glutathione S-transferase
MITLYGPGQAPYTEKVRRALIYKGLEFAFREPESAEDYARWSPRTGQLPVLDHEGEWIPDSTDILYRLEVLHPEPPLLARDPTVAAKQRQLEDWADESFSWHYMKYRSLVDGGEMPLPTAGDQDLSVSERVTSSALRRFAAWVRAGGTWERPVTGLLRQLGDRLDDLVNFLGARPFFYATEISMADLSVYGMLYTMRFDAIPGSAALLEERSALMAFMVRVEERTGGPPEPRRVVDLESRSAGAAAGGGPRVPGGGSAVG